MKTVVRAPAEGRPDVKSIVARLRSLGSQRNVVGMARYGIRTKKSFGVPTPAIRSLAGSIGTDRALAQKLWSTGILEAREVAFLIDDPAQVTEAQMERWVMDFDNWALCDGCCGNLFDRTPFAVGKALAWSRRKEEFVKRAGFVMMAELAVHDKKLPDGVFVKFLPELIRGSADERNFVRKAVNWALRQIGKRNGPLHTRAIRTAKAIRRLQSPAARWIAADALRELESAPVRRRLRIKQSRRTP